MHDTACQTFRSSSCLTFTFMFSRLFLSLLGIFFGYSFILFEPSFLSEHIHLTEHFLFYQNILVLISQDHLVPNYLSFKVSEHTAKTRALSQPPEKGGVVVALELTTIVSCYIFSYSSLYSFVVN